MCCSLIFKLSKILVSSLNDDAFELIEVWDICHNLSELCLGLNGGADDQGESFIRNRLAIRVFIR